MHRKVLPKCLLSPGSGDDALQSAATLNRMKKILDHKTGGWKLDGKMNG